MKVSEALEKGTIPIQYKGIVPLKCRCGAEIEVNETLTKMWCPGDKCISKQIARMNEMLTNFGVKNIGLSYCRDLWYEMERYGLGDSHMNVFLLPFTEYPQTYKLDVTMKKFEAIQNAVKEVHFNGGLTLGELVSKMALPGLDLNARKLFRGFSSVKEMQMYAKLRYKEQYSLLRLVQSRFGRGVACVKVIHTLAQFGKDIEIAQNIFTMRKSVNKEIKIAITGRITDYGRYTRKDFLRECNKICEGKVEILDVNPSSEIEFVVADDFIDSSTYDYGEEYGILISSDKFVQWLREEVLGNG